MLPWRIFSPQCQHTTAPPSFATSAWSRPLQHKPRPGKKKKPAACIINPGYTAPALSCCSPPAPPLSSALRPTDQRSDSHWPLTTDQRRTLGSLCVGMDLFGCALKRGQLSVLRSHSSCYQEPEECFWTPQHLLLLVQQVFFFLFCFALWFQSNSD